MASAAARNSQLIKAFENSFENVLANSRAGLAWQLRDPLAGAETSEGTDGGLSPPGWLSGLVGTQDSDTQTKAASYHVFALGPRLRKESYTPLCRFPLWGVRCRILSRAVTLQRFALPLNLPWVFSCVINQAAEPSGHCWSTTFIIVPKGFLWLDSRSFGSWNRDIHAARKTQACRPLQGLSLCPCHNPQGSVNPHGFSRSLQQASWLWEAAAQGEEPPTGLYMGVSEDTAIWHVSSLFCKIFSTFPVASAGVILPFSSSGLVQFWTLEKEFAQLANSPSPK